MSKTAPMPDHNLEEVEKRIRQQVAKEAWLTLVNNERCKLLTTSLDRIGTVFFTVGFATPLATLVYGLAMDNRAMNFTDKLVYETPAENWIAGTLVICILAALALHLLARSLLGELQL